MRNLRCQCGKRTAMTSMGMQDCEGCPECQTTFAGNPILHEPLQPHEWRPHYNSRTGEMDFQVCNKCGGESDLLEAQYANT